MSLLTPPDAERALLACCLRDPTVLVEFVLVITTEDFARDAHRHLWTALLTLTQAGRSADLVLVANELRRTDTLRHLANEAQDGYAYLAELWGLVATGGEAAYYAQLVRDASQRRHLLQAAISIQQDAESPTGSAAEAIAAAQQRLLALAEGVTDAAVLVRVAVDESLDRLDARAARSRGGLSGVPSGLADLDHLTSGFQDSELCIVAARPGSGKTALGLAIARYAAQAQYPVLLASLEQARTELAERLLAMTASIDGHKLRGGLVSLTDGEQLAEAAHQLRGLPLTIDDAARQSTLRIGAQARRLQAQATGRLGLIIVDYLQLIDPENRKDPRQEQVAGISRRLKQLARELRLPVIALAQLNRSADGERPRLSSLRESGSIEADADTVILLHRPEVQPDGPVVLIDAIVAKQRNGPTGEITLAYRKPFLRFEDYQPGSGSADSTGFSGADQR